MVVLFTDFGTKDSYVGQLHGVLHQAVAGLDIIDLLHQVPHFDIRSGAYLLPSFVNLFPVETVFVCIVDPGVGGVRRPLMLQVDGRWYVGPDNGLFRLLLRRASEAQIWEILWRPENLSASFHGRDLFAPVAGMLAMGKRPDCRPCKIDDTDHDDWPDDLARIIYIDHYGNAVTGLRAVNMDPGCPLVVGRNTLSSAQTFADVPMGAGFWYANANGLVEIAVNQGHAASQLGIELGEAVSLQKPKHGE
ncbi:MAG: SAM-dependent chlorinase/fluorinase [Gammaproteobacteria bacterium]|nr:SAM-dependent chlorinase/fluorinase [Gammaproteobacteria bacterium]